MPKLTQGHDHGHKIEVNLAPDPTLSGRVESLLKINMLLAGHVRVVVWRL